MEYESKNTFNEQLLKKRSTVLKIKEIMIKYFLRLNAFAASFFILLIFYFLLRESYEAFKVIGIERFFWQSNGSADASGKLFEWYPTSDNPRYSIIPLLAGSLLTAFPAVAISTIFGVIIGVFMSEVISNKFREILKPVIEMFAGIPTVVLGFFMLAVGAEIVRELFGPFTRLNAFLASVGLSFIVIPIIASLTEDALRSIPREVRMASYALGATRWQTISRIVLPAAVNGISAGIILGFGRAIGETMIVLMASGNAAIITIDIFSSVRTITATIAAEMGEVSQHSAHYFALFFIGVFLFSATFILNLIADIIFSRLKKRIRF